jgi:hypothetical protein
VSPDGHTCLEDLFGPEGAAEWRFSALFGGFGEFGEIRQNQVLYPRGDRLIV